MRITSNLGRSSLRWRVSVLIQTANRPWHSNTHARRSGVLALRNWSRSGFQNRLLCSSGRCDKMYFSWWILYDENDIDPPWSWLLLNKVLHDLKFNWYWKVEQPVCSRCVLHVKMKLFDADSYTGKNCFSEKLLKDCVNFQLILTLIIHLKQKVLCFCIKSKNWWIKTKSTQGNFS